MGYFSNLLRTVKIIAKEVGAIWSVSRILVDNFVRLIYRRVGFTVNYYTQSTPLEMSQNIQYLTI